MQIKLLLALATSAPALVVISSANAQSAPPQVIAVKLNQVKGVKPGKRVAGLSNWVRRLPTPHAARVSLSNRQDGGDSLMHQQR